jgi:large subunit ribosomal protein L1
MSGKKFQAIKQAAPTEAVDIPTAVAFLKEHARTSFDETIELHVHLGINPGKSEQMVRGQAALPSGTATNTRVAVFTADAKQKKAALEAGAALAGGEELIAAIAEKGSLDADIAVATPDMMPKIAKVARILGPQGIMPNPKTGTVSPEPAAVVKELMGGKISFKMDTLGNIHAAVGKAHWEADKIAANVTALLEAVKHARPAAMKGQLIKTITLASTMSPGIRITT